MGLFRRHKEHDEGSGRDPLAAIEPGVPGRCPRCDGFGYIDHLDLVNRYQTQHCRDCGHRWEYAFDADGHVVDVEDREPVLAELPDAPAPASEVVVDLTEDSVELDGDAPTADPASGSAADWLRRTASR